MTGISNKFWIALAALLLITVIAASTACAAEGEDYTPDELVCSVISYDILDSINATYGTFVIQYLPEIDNYLLNVPDTADLIQVAAEVSLWTGVNFCEPNYLLDAPEPVQSSQPFLDQLNVGTFPDQQAAQSLNLTQAQSISTGSSVSVAVIDAGVNFDNPILAPVAVSGFDYVDGDTLAADVPMGAASGHGTFVAGVVNLVAPAAQIEAYRVIDTSGRGNGFTVAEAILAAIAKGSRVINLSMVMSGRHSTVDDAIAFARDNNVVVVAAAGNDSNETERFPARDSYTLGVAGVDSLNHKADFSNYNNKVDICAPATQVYAPFDDSLFAWWDGTSFATPFVAGLCALLFENNPNATWNDIVDAITQTADNIDTLNPGYEGMLGAGVINPVNALNFFAVCGDANGDSDVNIGDVIYIVNYVFKSGPPPTFPEAADANSDGAVNVADGIYLVNFIFKSGTSPQCN